MFRFISRSRQGFIGRSRQIFIQPPQEIWKNTGLRYLFLTKILKTQNNKFILTFRIAKFFIILLDIHSYDFKPAGKNHVEGTFWKNRIQTSLVLETKIVRRQRVVTCRCLQLNPRVVPWINLSCAKTNLGYLYISRFWQSHSLALSASNILCSPS